MGYRDEISTSLVRSHIEGMDTGGRIEAREKELSPCSEYTRYTVEGVLKDPYSELSVLLDRLVMEFLFKNSALKAPKWSEALGYGMAMTGEETRIHVYKNGKFIIRRAADRKDAERSFNRISSILWPAVFSSRSDSFNWSILRKAAWDGDKKALEEPAMLLWPQEEGDHGKVLSKMKMHLRELDNGMGKVLRKDIEKNITGEEEALRNLLERMIHKGKENEKRLRSEIQDHLDDPLHQRSSFTYHLWIWMGLSHLEEYLRVSIPSGSILDDTGGTFWDLDERKREGTGPHGDKFEGLLKAKYMLGPVVWR